MMAHDKRLLAIAICASLVLHAALLALRFAPPAAERPAPFNTGLSVILVNAKHDHAPMQPDALAQANLDGVAQLMQDVLARLCLILVA